MANTATRTSTRRNTTTRTATPARKAATTRKPTTTRATGSPKPAAKRAAANGRAAWRSQAPRVDARAAVRSLVSESGYATVGVGDAAIAFVRTLPKRAETLTTSAQERARTLVSPQKLQELAKEQTERLTKLFTETATTVVSEFDGFVVRGRKVVGAVKDAAPTKRALDQTKVARSQVKAAVTSVRKAADHTGDAVEAAADKLGSTRSA